MVAGERGGFNDCDDANVQDCVQCQSSTQLRATEKKAIQGTQCDIVIEKISSLVSPQNEYVAHTGRTSDLQLYCKGEKNIPWRQQKHSPIVSSSTMTSIALPASAVEALQVSLIMHS